MLPSTGYFNGINCPFYENGLCERPYCHFKHVKKDFPNTTNEVIESGTILQKLVSAAVQKVLQQTESSGTVTSTQNLILDTLTESLPNVTTSKVTYNPTPISELNKINNTDAENIEDVNEQRKKHIPVPYTPRKPASIPIIRPVDTSASKPFIYVPPQVKYTPGSIDNIQTDKYTPSGTVESKEKYLPGSELQLQEYTPDTLSQDITTNKRNYVPSSDKNITKKKILEYKPTKVAAKTEKPLVTYQPTPRSLAPCFSSDEDEPDSKKRKMSSDLNGLDDLGPEFDILDQILDEEKHCDKNKAPAKSSECDKSKKNSKETDENNKSKSSKTVPKQSNGDSLSKTKSGSEKEHRSHHESKSDKKDKSSSEEKIRKDKHKHSDKKSSHKSSSRDRDKEKKDSKEKHSSDKKNSKSSHSYKNSSKHSSSKRSDNNSKSREEDKKKKSSHKESKDKSIHKNSDDSDHNHVENCSEELELSDADDETIAMECKKIFEEYVPMEKPKVTEDILKTEECAEEEYIPSKKRISRTTDKNVKMLPKAPLKPDFKVNAAQAMAERLAKVREFHSSRQICSTNSDNQNTKSEPSKVNVIAQSVSNTKVRIAHVPYASTLLNAKKTISPAQAAIKSQPSTSSTISQTVKKGSQRVAHIPNEKIIDRPGVLEPLGSKIAANVRSTYLNMMIDECLKLYVSTTDAYARAQNEELNTSKKCSTVQIYKNSAAMTVSRLRRELQECDGVKKTASSTTQSNSLGSWSIEGRNKKGNDNSKEFVGAKLFDNIKKWILTEEQLRENGFPRPHTSGEKGRANIYSQNKQKPPTGFLRTCCRCKKEYTVNKKGFAAVKEECIYHPNKKYRVRGEAKYQCCSQDATSDGCCVAPCHVYEYVDYDNLKGFVRTLPPQKKMDDYGVFSLDCEMCYTTHGLDLTRITVINSSCKVVYETLIKPLHPIIDYNTRYSGITEEQMVEVKTTLLEVQATLLSMFNSKTILVGHSLESDFKALKLIHDTVIDTSVLFPHKMGPPYKRALRNLCSEHLKKIIQNSVEGHDSAEDAMVCMELLHYKLKEDLKTR